MASDSLLNVIQGLVKREDRIAKKEDKVAKEKLKLEKERTIVRAHEPALCWTSVTQ